MQVSKYITNKFEIPNYERISNKPTDHFENYN